MGRNALEDERGTNDLSLARGRCQMCKLSLIVLERSVDRSVVLKPRLQKSERLTLHCVEPKKSAWTVSCSLFWWIGLGKSNVTMFSPDGSCCLCGRTIMEIHFCHRCRSCDCSGS
eukprot:4484878-Amphidinium_carterae.1